MIKGFALCTSVPVPEEFTAACWSKCSSTCSCREKLSLQTSEHMGQSRLFSPRTQIGNQAQCHVYDRNTEVAGKEQREVEDADARVWMCLDV